MRRILLMILVLPSLTGCGDFVTVNNGTGIGGSDVSGTVNGKPFEVISGSAEQSFDTDEYVITLADTSEYACQSTSPLPPDYLTIVISEFGETGSQSAEGRVFFNDFQDGVSVGEAAESGTVTIDEIDTFADEIRGSVDAAGPNSDVSGSFTVEICL